jgi:molybdopterin-binding protein
MEYKSHAIDSVITTQSAVELNLQDSDQVEWLVKANEMTLMKDQ